MRLKELLKNIKPTQIVGDENTDITGVNIDSRKIKPGHLFVAMKGTQVDGHQFIPKALDLGASAILCEDMPAEQKECVGNKEVNLVLPLNDGSKGIYPAS